MNFNLINMNGRTHDSVVERVLNVDNYVQNPNCTQGHKRYIYVMNHPLKYTDASRHTWLIRFKNWVSEQNPIFRSTVFLPTLMTLNPAIAID
ncbi:hypothetical protein CLV60_1369 [Dyadobacter jiangsuensis]|uniref:Uncharacterized protein n=1 Tax=Dyadobacter jiangsuensis TaxID=1591085 RepID=A0A2P8F7G4_9BACT|nr:hypothetical protein CLV60_1369 [Dyadobacter jiangsuensis]